jgi:hypothetical protein
MPTGELLTVPVPVPAGATVRVGFVEEFDGVKTTPRNALLVPAVAMVVGLPDITALYPEASTNL